jgi:hypothetical protein
MGHTQTDGHDHFLIRKENIKKTPKHDQLMIVVSRDSVPELIFNTLYKISRARAKIRSNTVISGKALR